MNSINYPRFVLSLLVLTSSLCLAAATGKPQQLTSPDQVPEGLAKSDWSSIRAAYEAGRHAFQPTEGGWQARNPGQQWTTKFDGRGFLSEPKGGGWEWGLELKRYGFSGATRAISGMPAVNAAGQRLTYDWDAVVQEWWVNDARGLEHGFIVRERPAAAGDSDGCLRFELAVRGSLTAQIAADGLGVLFRDAAGNTVINYSGLKVWDADGNILASRFKAIDSGSPTLITLAVDERGARYPLTVDPIAQQAYLKANNARKNDDFGFSVAVSGDTVVVGARGEDSSTTGVNSVPNESASDAGAAYVFVRSGTTWSQQAYLKPDSVGTTQQADGFGTSVAVSDDTVVVGAPYESSSSMGVNSTPNESGAGAGAAYVFVRSGTTWSQQAYLKPAATGTLQLGDKFGTSVAVSGDTVVVGAPYEDSSSTGVNGTPNESSSDAGAAYVFVRSGTTWSQQAYLKPAATGTLQLEDKFGTSVAVSGDTVVVGAPYEDSSSTGVNGTPNESSSDAGAAYVFMRSGTTWMQQAYLKPAFVGTTQAGDFFGYSVALSYDTVIVGSPLEDSSTTGVNSVPNETASNAGSAYIFFRNGTIWTQQAYLKPSAVGNSQTGDFFGVSVGISGETVVVGATQEASSTTGVDSAADEGSFGAGAAYVFVRGETTWTQQAYLKPAAVGTTQALDGFGTVAVSGDTVVVGAVYEDSSTTGVNSTPNEHADAAGAAYVFSGFGPVVSPPEIAVQQPQGTELVDGVASINFGIIDVGSSSSAKIFTVTNSGSAVLNLTNITKDGSHPGDFTLGALGQNSLAPGATTTFSVTFSPAGSGSRGAVIHIANNDTDENPFDIVLTGTATVILPRISVQQPAGIDLVDGTAVVDFGFFPLGSNSAPKTFIVTNTGSATLTLTSITKDGFHPGDFTVGALGQNSLAPGASTSFSVTFSPTGYGSRSAAIHISTSDGDENPFDIVLTGTGGTNNFQWARRVASTTNPDGELSIGMAVDSSGNAYVTGWFDGMNDFGGILLTNKSGGGQDIFLAKYDAAGKLQWAQRAGGSTARWDVGRGVGVDNAGNAYVTGGFHGTADFNGFNLTATDLGGFFSDFFLARYDSTGRVQWVRQSVGGFGVYGTGLAVDGAGNSYAVGYAENGASFSFGPFNLINTNLTGYSAFLVKYDNAGTAQWAQLLASDVLNYTTKVAVDTMGNVYARGGFTANLRIGSSKLVALGTSKNMFLAKFNSAGTLVWVQQATGGDVDEGGVAVDPTGNVYVSGGFDSALSFDGITITNGGSLDAFVAKYNSSGVIQWARRAGGTGLDFYWDVASDQQGNVHAVGVLSTNAAAPNGSGGAMVAKYDAAGTLQWAHSASGPPASPVGSITAKSAIDPAGNAYLAGWFRTPTTFGTNVLQTSGHWNYFLTRLRSTPIPVGVQISDLNVRSNQFRFKLTGTDNLWVAVDATTNLVTPGWLPLGTNTLLNGNSSFLDPGEANHLRRFYRLRFP